MRPPRVAIVGVRPASGESGGAERLYERLTNAMRSFGLEAELVAVESDEATIDTVKRSYLRAYDLDLSDFDGVISTKAPSYMVRHPNHICFLVHTMRVFYDMYEVEFPQPWHELEEHRRLIHTLDAEALAPPRTRRLFCIGHEVCDRIRAYLGLDSEALHLANTLEDLHCGEFRHIFAPGRLHRWKRVDLIIEAMKLLPDSIDLVVAGVGEQEADYRRLAGGDARIRFAGAVSDSELIDLYANALVVPFVPLREDFGFVTIEAFASRKPVITCLDSGEPTCFVVDGVNGFVCGADPAAIAHRIRCLVHSPALARTMGESGHCSIRDLSWTRVASTLATALGF